MSRIDELIAALCPRGVMYRPIGECVQRVHNIKWGDHDDSESFDYIDLTSVDRSTRQIANTQVVTSVNAPSRAQQLVAAGDVIFGTTRPMLKRFAVIPIEYDGQVCSTGFCVLRPDQSVILPRFLFHLLGTAPFYTFVEANERGASYPAISSALVKSARIPVPPLELQREIVGVLDKFAELGAKLEAELEAERCAGRLQLELHRNELLDFEGREDVRWLPLMEVARDFGRGKSKHRPRNDPKLYGGEIPFIQTGDIRSAGLVINEFTQTYSQAGLAQSKLWPAGTLCITIAANIAETTILGFDSCFPDSVIGFVADPTKADVRFVEHLLIHSRSALQAQGRGSAQSNINLATFENERLPFPPINEQARIASTLDKLDSLVTDLSRELKAEIAARRKQYEHYRDQLLTFKEAL